MAVEIGVSHHHMVEVRTAEYLELQKAKPSEAAAYAQIQLND